MIGFLTPWPIVIATVLSAVTVVLHLLSVRRPPVLSLPTARFIAPRDVRAVSRTARPTDLLLLVLRVLALLLAGAALSGPRWIPASQPLGVVIVADPSWRIDSARLMALSGIAAGESTPVRVAWTGADTIEREGASRSVHGMRGMRGELGAALPVAWREAASLLATYPATDSIALHVFAPPRTASVDGWSSWRAAWPGRVHVHTRADSGFTAARDSARTSTLRVAGASGDDPVVGALALHGPSLGVRRADPSAVAGSAARTVLLLRGNRDADDADGARGDASTTEAASHVTIVWPADGRPAGWQTHGEAGARPDTADALVVAGTVLASPWARAASWSAASGPATPIAWWNDGAPAAVERGDDLRCTREVGVPVPAGGDVLLAPSARALLAALLAPCGAWRGAPVPARILADSIGAATPASAIRAAMPVRATVTPAWLPAALLAAALLLLLAEWWLRRTGHAAAVGAGAAAESTDGVRNAA